MYSRARVAAITAATLLVASFAPRAQAAVPSAPVLVSPADNTTATSVDVPLAVTASDPDGGPVTVRFEGRKKGATVPGGGGGTPFTLVAIPDTQNYTYNNRQGTMNQQSQWVLNTRSQLNTAMVVQLGDLVSEEENATQWGLTSTAFKILDDAQMPNTVVPGNHDFNNDTGLMTEYNTWFGPSRYVGKTWTPTTASYGGYLGQNLFGTDPIDRGNADNFALFSAGGRDFLVLNLEWEAPSYALDWARKVLAAYPDRIAIMATHAFVNVNGQRKTVAERPGGTPANTMWNDFVAKQCSIRLVLNGHFHDGDLAEANRSDLNNCGQPVQQILTDYQDRANGGDGWLRYYTFDPAANTMTATTYSPKLNQYETDADSSFTLPFDLSTPQPAPFTEIATVTVNSGQTATTTWTGRDPDTAYEWRAVAKDATDSTTSPTWTVRTPVSSDYVDDTFTRNVTNGWGAPDATHAWQLNSSVTSFSVDGSVGKVSVPAGSGRGGTVTGVSATDVRVSTDLSLAQNGTGSGTYVSLMARANGTTSYRSKLRYLGGALTLTVGRMVNGTETTLTTATVAGVTATPGLPLRFKLETEGTSPTTLRAKVWPSAAAEPSAWTVSATDSTAALQVAGTAGLDLYVSSSATATSVLSFDRFTVSRLGTVTPPANAKPTAAIGNPNISGLDVSFSGAGSSDTDGTIAGYSWNFGDNTSATGVSPSHSYTTGGTYTVTLTVTDDDGDTGTATRQVTVTAANAKPTAAIGNPTINDLTVSVSGADSSDTDGTITGYSWNFGDNTAAGTGVSATHTYAAAGTYTLTLTVTDDDGDTGTASKPVTVTAPPVDNVKPTAVIGTPDVTDLTVKVSGSGSSDSDGTVTGYAWTYGDGGTATGVSPAAHTYSTAGTYTVTLTVTDDDGATDTASKQVTVTAPPVDTALARDAFGRTASNGWGSADVGGTWTFNGTTNRFSVAGGKGLQALTSPGNTADAQLASVNAASAEVRVTLAWSRTGSGGTIYGSVLPRRISSTTDYRCKVVAGSNGVIQLILVRRVSSTETAIGSANVSGFTMTANQAYDVACSATPSGTGTLLRAKLWRDGTAEPAAWQVSATDSTAALQAAGGIGISSYMSSSATAPVTLSVDDLSAVTP